MLLKFGIVWFIYLTLLGLYTIRVISLYYRYGVFPSCIPGMHLGDGFFDREAP